MFEWTSFTVNVRKECRLLLGKNYVYYIFNTNGEKTKSDFFLSDAEDIYRVGTEVHNSRCPPLKMSLQRCIMGSRLHQWVVERHRLISALRKQSQWISRHCLIEQNLQSHSNSHNFFINVYIFFYLILFVFITQLQKLRIFKIHFNLTSFSWYLQICTREKLHPPARRPLFVVFC